MESSLPRSLLLDASAWFNNPELSDVTIILVGDTTDDFLSPAERPAKRQRSLAGAAAATQHDAEGQANEEVLADGLVQEGANQPEQQTGTPPAAAAAAEQGTLRLHGHTFLLSASSSVFRTRIANWSAEDNSNELRLHVSGKKGSDRYLPKWLAVKGSFLVHSNTSVDKGCNITRDMLAASTLNQHGTCCSTPDSNGPSCGEVRVEIEVHKYINIYVGK